MNIICLRLSTFYDPIVVNAPRCMIAAPSPSKQNTFLLGLANAIPCAIELACPIEPTVRKSFSCPYYFLTLSSHNSRDRNPVVETTTSCAPS